MCLTLRSLISRLVPLLLGMNVCFQLQSKTIVLDARFKTSIFYFIFIKVENGRFKPKKRKKKRKKVANLKLSSLKLGTCQGQNSITLAYQTPFQNRHCQTCVASPSFYFPSSIQSRGAHNRSLKIFCTKSREV